jgi:hypothetical protein
MFVRRGLGLIGVGIGILMLHCSSSETSAPAAGGDGGTEGGTNTPAPPTPGATTVSGSGASVDVPAGTSDVVITIATDAPPLPPGVTALGNVFAFTPHGKTFASPVTIHIPFTAPTSGIPVLYTASPGGAWTPVEGATNAGGMSTAKVSHFSFFAVGGTADDCSPAGTSCAPGRAGCCVDPAVGSKCAETNNFTCCNNLGGACSDTVQCCGADTGFFVCEGGACCAKQGGGCGGDEDCCQGFTCIAFNCGVAK